jgi:MFS family permease
MTTVPAESTRRRGGVALLAVCLSALMFGLEISSIPAILPTLRDPAVLGADFAELQWIMNAYTLAVTVVLMGTGTLADRFGRKRVFIASVVAFGLASLMCGLAPTTPVLIAARFLQGMSGGVMLICQVAVLSQPVQRRERTRAWHSRWWGIIFGDRPRLWADHRQCDRFALSGWAWVFLDPCRARRNH